MGLRRALSRCWALACLASGWQRVPRPFHRATPLRAAFHAEGDLSGAFQLSGVWKLERQSDDAVDAVPIQPTNPSWSGTAGLAVGTGRPAGLQCLCCLKQRGRTAGAHMA